MYLRIGNRIINTATITDACVIEPGETPGDGRPVEEFTVVIYTTGTEYVEGVPAGRAVRLTGVDAEKFLRSLPVYEPVLD